jgi:hypothetical protein
VDAAAEAQMVGWTAGLAAFPAAYSAAKRPYVLRDSQCQGEEGEMNYFTPNLHLKLQRSNTAEMDAADAEWEQAEAKYEHRLAAIRDKLPQSAIKLLNGLRLHDAEVLWMGHAGSFFAVLLALEPHLNTTVLLTYRTIGSVQFDNAHLATEFPASKMQWMYDEIDLSEQAACFRHSILFSDCSELQLEASEVQIMTVDTIYSPATPWKIPA